MCKKSVILFQRTQRAYHVISYHIISYHIISYHIISYHIKSCHSIIVYMGTKVALYRALYDGSIHGPSGL